MSEMLHIKYNSSSINVKTDSHNLRNIYDCILCGLRMFYFICRARLMRPHGLWTKRGVTEVIFVCD